MSSELLDRFVASGFSVITIVCVAILRSVVGEDKRAINSDIKQVFLERLSASVDV